jgi:hypothetical protein
MTVLALLLREGNQILEKRPDFVGSPDDWAFVESLWVEFRED